MIQIACCEKGHYYDAAHYTNGCPYCNNTAVFGAGVAAAPAQNQPETELGVTQMLPKTETIPAAQQPEPVNPTETTMGESAAMQGIVRCPSGHVYETNRFPEGCPYCRPAETVYIERSVMQGSVPVGEATVAITTPVTTPTVAEPVVAPVEEPVAAEPTVAPVAEPIAAEPTVAPVEEPAIAPQPVVPEEEPEQLVYGWLVDLDPEKRGQIYSLGIYTFIACEEKVTAFPQRDAEKKGFQVIFDERASAFFIPFADPVLINGKEKVTKINFLRYHDTLTFGEKSFLFVPLCDREFVW